MYVGLLSSPKWQRAVITALLLSQPHRHECHMLSLEPPSATNYQLETGKPTRGTYGPAGPRAQKSRRQASAPPLMPPLGLQALANDGGLLNVDLGPSWALSAAGLLSSHRWKRAVIAALLNQPHAVPTASGLERSRLSPEPRQTLPTWDGQSSLVAHI